MEKKTLIPRTIVEIEGKLAYREGFQCWNTIRLKDDFIKEFPQLREKRSQFSYKLVFHRNSDEFEKAIKDMKKNGTMPLLMFIYKDNKE